MLLVGLTGGIGAGKSAVAAMLARRGAVVLDADDLARLAVEPGSHGYAEVLRTFGPRAVAVGGELDREWLASTVFGDPEARRRLEAIVHPEVARLLASRVEALRDSDEVVVYAVPLLVENRLEGMFDVVVVVWAPVEERVRRLAAARGMDPEAARERMAAQASDRERERVADVVLRNDGSLEDLERQVDRLWSELRARTPAGPAEAPTGPAEAADGPAAAEGPAGSGGAPV
jgi:dephospho-CoA kinase